MYTDQPHGLMMAGNVLGIILLTQPGSQIKNFIGQFTDVYDLKRELERLETMLIEAFGPIVNDKVSFTSKGVKSKLKDSK